MRVTLLIALSILPAGLAAEDRVTLRTTSGAGKAVLTGTVTEWTGEMLRIRSSNGDIRELPADRIVDVQTARTQSHIDGLEALDKGEPDKARRLLKEALGQDPREWMRREVLASLVRAELARGDRAAAATNFLALIESDPTTRHFELIPLDWRTDPPTASLAAAARTWLSSDDNVHRLLGASVLLFDQSDGDTAATALGRLAASPDRHIYPLARAQLWRRQLARGDVPEAEIRRWEDRINQIAEPLRGGAYWLIGQAWADSGNAERAATALLWLPLVYDADALLSADAAVAAAEQLTKIGRTADAIVLYRETVSRFPYASAAKTAQEALDRFAELARQEPKKP